MLSNEVIEVAKSIGEFYLQKNNHDYEKTSKEILKLRITKLELIEDKVIITTCRPGMLIGKKCENVEALSVHLGKNIKIIEAIDDITDWIIPHEPDPYDYVLDKIMVISERESEEELAEKAKFLRSIMSE
jgi:hypothetical protein